MKSFKVKYIISFTFVYLCAVLTGAGAQKDNDYTYTPLDPKENFSWKLMKNIFGKEKNNVVLSPFHLKNLLAVLAGAAIKASETQNELYEAIEFTDNSREIHKEILAVLREKNPFVTVNLETKIYADEGKCPEGQYLRLLANFYGTGFEKTRFDDVEASAKKINSWCKNVTNGMLSDLVKPNDLTETVVMFASVLYFNGLWSLEFDTPTEGVFYTTPTTTRQVQYMSKTDTYFFSTNKSLNFEMARIPYKGKSMSMFVILPKKNYGIEDVLNSLENNQIRDVQSKMQAFDDSVTLPKFKFDFETNLKEILPALGINQTFADETVLLGLQLKSAKIIQKSGIDVSEKGTEAYDAEAALYNNRISSSSQFKVDRPFIFFIEEETTGSILFAGKVVEPLYE